jgi:hypothetical protein
MTTERALNGLLVSRQRPTTKFGYVYVTGIRRQPIRNINARLRDLGVTASRLLLCFIDDSNTLSICLPESAKPHLLECLKNHGLTVRTDLNPEDMAFLDMPRFALPDDRRKECDKKRVLQQYQRLALGCPISDLPGFMSEEIKRMGGTLPTRRQMEDASWTRIVYKKKRNKGLRRPQGRPTGRNAEQTAHTAPATSRRRTLPG